MIKIGMMIGDRYEILEKIGTGGMSKQKGELRSCDTSCGLYRSYAALYL